jgi:hypothetical protein
MASHNLQLEFSASLQRLAPGPVVATKVLVSIGTSTRVVLGWDAVKQPTLGNGVFTMALRHASMAPGCAVAGDSTRGSFEMRAVGSLDALPHAKAPPRATIVIVR